MLWPLLPEISARAEAAGTGAGLGRRSRAPLQQPPRESGSRKVLNLSSEEDFSFWKVGAGCVYTAVPTRVLPGARKVPRAPGTEITC